MINVGVLGAGSWGSALAILLDGNGHQVTLWSPFPSRAEWLKKTRDLSDTLPETTLNENIKVTDSLEEVCNNQDLLVFAVASPYIRSTANNVKPYLKDKQLIVNVSKGIEEETLFTLSDILNGVLPNGEIAVLSGPSHAEEVSKSLPTTCVVGAKNKKDATFIQDVFMNERFRVYTSQDIVGIELGGSLKNVIALAAGIADGLGFGDNTKAALMTRGIAEISRLGLAMGGKLETFAGLSGIGDLIVTCTSKHSRNRSAGSLIGQGYSKDEAMKEVNQVVEGVNSAKAALTLAKKFDVEMPIVEQVNLVLFENKNPKEAVDDLLLRDKRKEFE